LATTEKTVSVFLFEKMDGRLVQEGEYTTTIYGAIKDGRYVFTSLVLSWCLRSVFLFLFFWFNVACYFDHCILIQFIFHSYAEAIQILEFERENFPRSRAVRHYVLILFFKKLNLMFNPWQFLHFEKFFFLWASL
jgi:hypothetical protein